MVILWSCTHNDSKKKNKNEIEFRGLQYIIYKYARLFGKIECLYKT